jgi:hypothetical protein
MVTKDESVRVISGIPRGAYTPIALRENTVLFRKAPTPIKARNEKRTRNVSKSGGYSTTDRMFGITLEK